MLPAGDLAQVSEMHGGLVPTSASDGIARQKGPSFVPREAGSQGACALTGAISVYQGYGRRSQRPTNALVKS